MTRRNTYFGSYREVFARDLYETFTGLLASGDVATAKDTVRFLFERQQQPDGSMPRNSLVNGKLAPDSFGVQLDEVAYPILMARTVGLTDKAFYLAHIKRAADYVVAHGPSFGNERWEEQSGYSPSTIAAEIAGLAAAGTIAAPQRRRRRRADLPRHRRPLPAEDQDLDGDDDRPAAAPSRTSSGCPRPATRTRRSPTTSATAARTPTSAPSSTPASWSCRGSAFCPADDPDVAATLPLVDEVIGRTTRQRPGLLPLRRRHPRHRGRLRRLQHRRLDGLHGAGQAMGRRLRRPGPEPGIRVTSGRCWPVSGPSTRSPLANDRQAVQLLWRAWPPPRPASG